MRISAATRDRVLAAAEEIGYRPNAFARALRTSRSRTIGVVVTDTTNPFLTSLLREVDAAARSRGYHLILVTAQGGIDLDQADPSAGVLGMMDAFIILGEPPNHLAVTSELIAQLKPVIYVAREGQTTHELAVSTDNAAGVHLALDYLYDLGHRRMACIAGPATADMNARLAAYRRFLADHGIAGSELVCSATDDYLGGFQAARDVLASDPQPSAIFVCDDVMAVGAMRAVAEAQVAVPEMISVIGFDGITLGEFITPPLTTVVQPVQAMAEGTLDLAVQLLEEGEPRGDGATTLSLQPRLLIRASCAPPAPVQKG